MTKIYSVAVTEDWSDVSQTWWAHLDCFKDRLHLEARYFRPEFE